jgi:hypothetical protein
VTKLEWDELFAALCTPYTQTVRFVADREYVLDKKAKQTDPVKRDRIRHTAYSVRRVKTRKPTHEQT